MAISGSEPAQITARCGVARCATIRLGCAPNDIEDTDSGVVGQIVHSEPTAHLSTSEGTVVEWGIGGAGGGVDELAGGD